MEQRWGDARRAGPILAGDPGQGVGEPTSPISDWRLMACGYPEEEGDSTKTKSRSRRTALEVETGT